VTRENQKLHGFNGLAEGTRAHNDGLQTDFEVSEGGAIWNDFAATTSFGVSSCEYRGRLRPLDDERAFTLSADIGGRIRRDALFSDTRA
jgi:hypothetical protein